MKVKTKKTMSSMKKTIDVPNGSYDFIIYEWDDFNKCHEMQYKVKTNYAGTFGMKFSQTIRHTESVLIEEKGNWVVSKMENNKIFLKNISYKN